jgi:hypothetical protein
MVVEAKVTPLASSCSPGGAAPRLMKYRKRKKVAVRIH